jgi:hypothetical protein
MLKSALLVLSIPLFLQVLSKECPAMHPADRSSSVTLNGYARSVAGKTIEYEAPLPWLTRALIARASDGRSAIEWESDPLVEPAGHERIRLVWLAGLGCNLGEKRFQLAINGRPALEFSNRDAESWQARGNGGELLSFAGISRDRYQDRFGLMTLDLPAGGFPAGHPLTLRVTGDSAASQAWVMTFTGSVHQEILVRPAGLILRNNGKPLQPVSVEIVFLQKSGRVTLRPQGEPEQHHPLHFGRNTFTLYYPPVESETARSLQVQIGAERIERNFVLQPVRPWQVFFVQHTHTDIGYTRPQTDILAEHLRYIDYALDYCDQTDALPDDARFRWTCETSWAVREYIRCRPASQIERLKRRVQEGRIEVTAQLLNWAEVADENGLLHSLEAVRSFRELGMPVQTAMQNDVNGYAWCLVDYFDALGINYVTSGINTHRALKPFAVPTAIWWESPAGKRVLAFRADHYMTGNMIGLTGGGIEPLELGLPRYLDKLAADGYAMNAVSLQYSGYFTDNAPPSTIAAGVIKEWNEKYLYPALRSATAREFLELVERQEGEHLPVFRTAWPDWWTDGYGCAVRETAAGRTTQGDMLVNQGLLAMARLWGAQLPAEIPAQQAAVLDNLDFYNEHTFGAAESISDPLAENSQIQWSEKSSYVWQAVMHAQLLREAALGQLQALLMPAECPTIAVFNTLNWRRSGLHTLYIDNQILPKEKAFRLVDEEGREAAVQLLSSRAEGNTWALWVEDVPAMGCKIFRIEVREESAPLPAKRAAEADLIENAFYRAELDAEKGTLRSLHDRELGLELLDPDRQWDLGQFIYERLEDRHPLEELRLGVHSRTPLQKVVVEPGADGPIWQSVIISGESGGFTGGTPVRCELRFYNKEKLIELVYRARKLAVTDPEAVYIAFPFFLPGGGLVFEAQGGPVHPGENQLEGTASDWNTVQNFAAVRSDRGQIVLVSGEIPLMQFGDINTGRYERHGKPRSQQIFSWVLNNYWTTNFRASQEGEMSWSYQLTSAADTSNAFATRFGWSWRVPFASRVLPAAGRRSAGSMAPASAGQQSPGPGPDLAAGDRNPGPVPLPALWPFDPAPVLLVAARPMAEGVLLHLRELSGSHSRLRLREGADAWQAAECDPFGRIQQIGTAIDFQPYEVKFVRLWR